VALFGEHAATPHPPSRIPEVAPWSEHDRLAREKAVLGFFISGHPLARYRVEVELFGTRTTATLGQWSDQRVRVAAVATVVKRQISKKTGAEYARLTLEDFHGTAEALVFPEAWAKLNEVIRTDRALLLAGSYSGRDRDEEQAPFIVETAQPLDELKASGAIGIALRWSPGAPPPPDAARAAAALCAAHPGPAPVLVEWTNEQENGDGAVPGLAPGVSATRLRSRSLRVEVEDDLLVALRALLGPDHVQLVRADPRLVTPPLRTAERGTGG
jgi:DNA polymerase-3 subunit alpha